MDILRKVILGVITIGGTALGTTIVIAKIMGKKIFKNQSNKDQSLFKTLSFIFFNPRNKQRVLWNQKDSKGENYGKI